MHFRRSALGAITAALLAVSLSASALEVSVSTYGAGEGVSSSFVINGHTYVANKTTGVLWVSVLDGYQAGQVKLYPDGQYEVFYGATPTPGPIPTATPVPKIDDENGGSYYWNNPVPLAATPVPEFVPTEGPQQETIQATAVPAMETARPVIQVQQLFLDAEDPERGTLTGGAEGDQELKVEFLTFGLSNCALRLNGYETLMDTRLITFSQAVPVQKKLAVIGSTGAGRLAVRNEARQDARKVGYCKTGEVVAVLGFQGDYVLVRGTEVTGYVNKYSVDYYEAIPALGKGIVTLKGQTDGNQKVPVRLKPDRGAAAAQNFTLGTEVTLLNEGKYWYEIECQGIHGYLMKENITVK